MNVYKRLRKEKKLTQKELAEILHISDTAISKWELNQTIPDYPTLKKIAEFFNVTTDYLLGQNQSPQIPKELEGIPIAFHGDVEGLSQKGIEQIARYIKFIKEEERDKNGK